MLQGVRDQLLDDRHGVGLALRGDRRGERRKVRLDLGGAGGAEALGEELQQAVEAQDEQVVVAEVVDRVADLRPR